MTTTDSQIEADISSYLNEVAEHLADRLTEAELVEMLDDLREHLREVALENPGKTLEEAVGTPSEYADELLASVGTGSASVARGTKNGSLRSLRSNMAAFRSTTVGKYLEDTLPALRPAWWVMRAYIAVLVLSRLTDVDNFSGTFPIPQIQGSRVVGVFVLATAILISVSLGRSKLPAPARMAVYAGDVLAVVALLSLINTSSPPPFVYASPPENPNPGCLTNSAGQRITNIYAYDLNGTLLNQIHLFDQSGKPIDNLCVDYDSAGRPLRTQYEKDANGAPVYSIFPRRQWVGPVAPPVIVEDSGRVISPTPAQEEEKPVTPPAVVIPRLATPQPPTGQ